MDNFDPDSPGIANGNFFGLPCDINDSSLVIIAVPWDVTVSYGSGAAAGPEAMINASLQIDLFDLHNPEGWKKGIATIPPQKSMYEKNEKLRRQALKVIKHLEKGGSEDDNEIAANIEAVNVGCEEMNEYVRSVSEGLLAAGKKVCIAGGDHSTPLGLIQALGERFPKFGILHIDAHADLRKAYEGFGYSHASVMYNVLNTCESVSSLVQVGVRDLCSEERELALADDRITQFDDYMLNAEKFHGRNWVSVCADIIERLPHNVYISFDIDGLSPDNCPGTGTPVPGGLSFHEAVYLVGKVRESGREIIGFDLCEVAPGETGEFDANVGARVLFKLCNIALKA